MLSFLGPPKQPGSPSVYSNEPGLLRLQWDELDHGNMPVDTFYLQYRIGITSLLLLLFLLSFLLLLVIFKFVSF